MLAFTPAPQVIKVQLPAKALGKLPADFHYHCLIMVGAAPSFVKFEGSLQLVEPHLAIELLSPRLVAQAEDNTISSK